VSHILQGRAPLSLPLGAEPFVLSPAVKYVNVRIYKNIILPVVLYGCETWSLTVREEGKN
jgi:hypothetical protein